MEWFYSEYWFISYDSLNRCYNIKKDKSGIRHEIKKLRFTSRKNGERIKAGGKREEPKEVGYCFWAWWTFEQNQRTLEGRLDFAGGGKCYTKDKVQKSQRTWGQSGEYTETELTTIDLKWKVIKIFASEKIWVWNVEVEIRGTTDTKIFLLTGVRIREKEASQRNWQFVGRDQWGLESQECTDSGTEGAVSIRDAGSETTISVNSISVWTRVA